MWSKAQGQSIIKGAGSSLAYILSTAVLVQKFLFLPLLREQASPAILSLRSCQKPRSSVSVFAGSRSYHRLDEALLNL